MMKLIARFHDDESGATAIEYCLITSIIALTILGGAQLLGQQLGTISTGFGDKVAETNDS